MEKRRQEQLGLVEREMAGRRAELEQQFRREAVGIAFSQWTRDWQTIAEQSCPECLKGFWSEAAGDDACVCRCGSAYHPACLQLRSASPGELCRAKPGDHFARSEEFRKIKRWPDGKKLVPSRSLHPERGSLHFDGHAAPKRRTRRPDPTSGPGFASPNRHNRNVSVAAFLPPVVSAPRRQSP